MRWTTYAPLALALSCIGPPPERYGPPDAGPPPRMVRDLMPVGQACAVAAAAECAAGECYLDDVATAASRCERLHTDRGVLEVELVVVVGCVGGWEDCAWTNAGDGS